MVDNKINLEANLDQLPLWVSVTVMSRQTAKQGFIDHNASGRSLMLINSIFHSLRLPEISVTRTLGTLFNHFRTINTIKLMRSFSVKLKPKPVSVQLILNCHWLICV